MFDGIRQQFGGGAHDTRHVAGRVNHGIPLAASQRVEMAVAAATQLFHVGEQVGISVPTIEQRHAVTVRQRRLDNPASQEDRTAENE